MSSPSVFHDICPHGKVDRQDQAQASLLSEHQEIEYYPWLEKIHPESQILKNYRQTIARKTVPPAVNHTAISSSSVSSTLMAAGEAPKSIGEFENLLLRADLLCLAGQRKECEELLGVLSKIPLHPGRGMKRAVQLRLYTLNRIDHSAIQDTYEYITGRSPSPKTDNATISYLKRKNGFQNNFLMEFPDEYRELNREVRKLNASYFEGKRSFAEAKEEWAKIVENEPQNDFIKMEIDRMAFMMESP